MKIHPWALEMRKNIWKNHEKCSIFTMQKHLKSYGNPKIQVQDPRIPGIPSTKAPIDQVPELEVILDAIHTSSDGRQQFSSLLMGHSQQNHDEEDIWNDVEPIA